MSKKKDLGRYISYILRHNPSVINIKLDEHGWANVDELISGINKTRIFDFKMLEQIVCLDTKGRYSFNEDKTLIRANQGHSIEVDVELREVKEIDVLYHGSSKKYQDSINNTGLIRKSRLYVHLSSDINTAIKVGKRHGDVVVYQVNAKQMLEDGYKFYKSVNGVYLTKVVPIKYLKVLQIGDNDDKLENI